MIENKQKHNLSEKDQKIKLSEIFYERNESYKKLDNFIKE